MPKTPVTREGLEMYDDLPAVDAVVAAWANPGIDPVWHQRCMEAVSVQMPLLARALDRLTLVELARRNPKDSITQGRLLKREAELEHRTNEGRNI
jgi:hypothetical protein